MTKLAIISSLVLLCFSSSLEAQEGKRPGKDEKLNLVDKNGKKHGTWLIQTPARRGEPATSTFGSFEHGKKLGIWYTINREGDFLSMETFRNDLLDGEAKYYDEKGRLYCTGNYKALNPHKEIDTIVVMDPITHEESFRVISGAYGSVRHGTWMFYDPASGQLLRKDEYQVDDVVQSQTYAMVTDSSLIKKREASLPHNKKLRSNVPPGKKVSYTN